METVSLTRRRLLKLAGAGAAMGLLQACAPGGTNAPTSPPAQAPTSTGAGAPAAAPTAAPAIRSAPGPKETFVYGIFSDPSNLDPHVSTDGLSRVVVGRSRQSLVQSKLSAAGPPGGAELEPDVAESWKASDDGLKYTFTLRKGLKFADGTPLNAAAVKFSFDRLMGVNKNVSQIRELKSTDVVDDATVQMTLSKSNAYFLPIIASWQFSIVNPKVMEKAKNNDWGQAWLAGNVMGSGPYVLSDWNRGQTITLDYNPNWSGKEPAIKRVIFRIIPETTNLRLQLEKGDVDFVYALSTQEAVSEIGKPGVKVVDAPSTWFILAYLNNSKPPFDNVKVRQAMNYAINYDALIKEVIAGKGRRANGPLACGMEGYDETLKGYDYNPQKAKDLLKEAGFPNGFETLLTYAPTGGPGMDEVALASQAYLKDVGIKVSIEKVAEPTRRERIDKNDFQWSIGSWSPGPLPFSTMLRIYHSSLAGLNANRAFYKNPKVDELVTTAQTIMDLEKRVAMYREAQKIVVEEAPYIFFYLMNQIYAMRDHVGGFEWQPGSSQALYFERLSKK